MTDEDGPVRPSRAHLCRRPVGTVPYSASSVKDDCEGVTCQRRRLPEISGWRSLALGDRKGGKQALPSRVNAPGDRLVLPFLKLQLAGGARSLPCRSPLGKGDACVILPMSSSRWQRVVG